MEPQQQQPNEDSSVKGSFVCRQSSTRWTPTTDQIRILKDLYYNNGVRSPSADQIQRISARLRQYGKIEGKNVFYWFQNHKARERQKKRFTTTDLHVPMQKPNVANNKYPNPIPTIISPGSSPSSTGVLTVGQIGNYGCGSMTMEKSFRDCSISACGSSSGGANANESLSHNIGWVCMDPTYTSSYDSLTRKKSLKKKKKKKKKQLLVDILKPFLSSLCTAKTFAAMLSTNQRAATRPVGTGLVMDTLLHLVLHLSSASTPLPDDIIHH